jgi:hypothetical protein
MVRRKLAGLLCVTIGAGLLFEAVRGREPILQERDNEAAYSASLPPQPASVMEAARKHGVSRPAGDAERHEEAGREPGDEGRIKDFNKRIEQLSLVIEASAGSVVCTKFSHYFFETSQANPSFDACYALYPYTMRREVWREETQ